METLRNLNIVKTTDGGETWTNQLSGLGIVLRSVSFIDINNAITVGEDGIILKSTDGGTNWFQQSSGTTNDLNAVSFADLYNGNIVGPDGGYPQYN